MDNAIEVKSLSKSYKDVSVLRDASFSVQKGTVFALLGSNGAGKTTTINILTTLIKADGGTAAVAGFDVAARPDRVRKEISLTGQFAAVDNRLTGRENLLLIGDLRHVADSAETPRTCCGGSGWRKRPTGAYRRSPVGCAAASTSP